MAAAALVTRPGGPIICAAACEDGLPDHGSYARLLASASTPQGLLDMISALPETVPDQWQVQVQARIQVEHEVFVHADGLSDAAIRAAHFTPSDDVTETLDRLIGERPDRHDRRPARGSPDDRLRGLTRPWAITSRPSP